MDWIRAPITGKLEEVPGLGHKNIEHLGIITDAEREMGEGEAVGKICLHLNCILIYFLLYHNISSNLHIIIPRFSCLVFYAIRRNHQFAVFTF